MSNNEDDNDDNDVNDDNDIPTFKIVFLGEWGSGRTSFLMKYRYDFFPDEYVPSVMDSYSSTKIVENKPVNILIVDAEDIRDISLRLDIRDINVGVICFSVADPYTFERCEYWIEKIYSVEENPPILLLGLRTDLRNDITVIEALQEDGTKPITTKQGIDLAKELDLKKYLECSTLNDDVKPIMDEIIGLTINKEVEGKKKKCIIS